MKRLVLLGGGHAHVRVLSDFAARPVPGWEVHLVTPYRRQIYSGMLPGWIAGHHPIESCAIALDSLTAKGGIAFHETSGLAFNPASNVLRCADGGELPFDYLSIDTGPMPSLDRMPGAVEHTLPVRPIERFVAAWPDLTTRIAGSSRAFHLAIVGSGAAGIELAFAIQYRAAAQGWAHLRLALIDQEELPVPGAPAALRQRLVNLLRQREIDWIGKQRVTQVEVDSLILANGFRKAFDFCLVSTGAAAPKWAAESGVSTDHGGFICVGPTLQSVSHPNIFAAGDVASYHLARPKSGVYAVRAGPVLAANLRAVCEGGPLRRWKPQARALYLLNTGDRRALAMWGSWTWGGAWVWRWKDHIDRRFMRRNGTPA